jgi:hypothetical protein
LVIPDFPSLAGGRRWPKAGWGWIYKNNAKKEIENFKWGKLKYKVIGIETNKF